MHVHLDTDIGGDTDDVCALAMLLGSREVESVTITTTIDPGGTRAACARHILDLAGRSDVRVIAGAERSLTRPEVSRSEIHNEKYWPYGLMPRPAPIEDALDLLATACAEQKVIIAIGPLTNLAMLEQAHPGMLAATAIVVVGGWVDDLPRTLSAWSADMDWNIQWDTTAAKIVVEAANELTLVPFGVTLRSWLRERDLPRLRESGPLGALIATQASAHVAEHDMPAMGRTFAELPDDLLNFQYDPVGSAVALGWDCVRIEDRRLTLVEDEGLVRFEPATDGRHLRVATKIDSAAFAERWLQAVERASGAERRATSRPE